MQWEVMGSRVARSAQHAAQPTSQQVEKNSLRGKSPSLQTTTAQQELSAQFDTSPHPVSVTLGHRNHLFCYHPTHPELESLPSP
ncbi:hypothetical protein PCANC_11513 [Puccinia coronata f. sp. avenae]|uniref:Uncharacterized protein n=1 Tax=Puccinia coronata f. sp. avenae TaxID=200324 RepID=A0A2N5UVI8_9BASI|nr:hypothetical protein PCANC_11513 [Puccinia coronata f. sp. avenae]